MPEAIDQRAEIFDKVIVEHSGAILHFLYSRCGDWGMAEDLSQNFWSYVFRKFSLEAMQQKGLLYHKAKQIWIDHYRKITRRPDLTFTDELPEPVLMPERSEPETQSEDRELAEKFWSLFHPNDFDELAKTVFWLHERYGYTMVEISQRLGIPKSTLHDKLTHIKAQCLERLENHSPHI